MERKERVERKEREGDGEIGKRSDGMCGTGFFEALASLLVEV